MTAPAEANSPARTAVADPAADTVAAQTAEGLARADQILAAAMTRKRWTDADEDSLRGLLASYPNADWVSFMQELGATLSSGEMQVVTR